MLNANIFLKHDIVKLNFTFIKNNYVSLYRIYPVIELIGL